MKSQNSITKSDTEKKSPALKRKSAQKKSSDLLTHDYKPLENITCKIGDNACAAKHISAIQRTGLFHPMNEGQKVQSLLRLQQQYGNRFVQKIIGQHALQTKLKIGQPGDIYKQEADRIAEQIMRMPEPQVWRQAEEEELIQTKPIATQITPLVQRQEEEKEGEEEEKLQAKELPDQTPGVTANEELCRQPEEEEEEEILQTKDLPGQTSEVSPNLETRINAIRGGGQPLPTSARAFFEPRFGHDFSQVQVHTDAEADTLNRALNARAFTIDRNIVFGTGQYTPETKEGKKLLAHELTHVLQQISLKRFIQRQKLEPFEEAEIKPLETIYSEANRATHNCISILNKAIKTIYKEELKDEKLRSTIQNTMGVLESLNLVGKPTIVEFLDSEGEKTEGTKEPHKLSRSVEGELLGLSVPLNGWYLYGLSIMDGYHSVLIAVQVTNEEKKLYWLDQTKGFKETTGNLNSEIETKTIGWWKAVKARTGVGYKTRTTFWPFVRILGDFPIPSKAYAYA